MARDLGYEYTALRDATAGRSETTREEGKPFMFSSARKMMSWAVKRPGGGYRLYSKGASEVRTIRHARALLHAAPL
jgi:Ca2+ transporting ATPase